MRTRSLAIFIGIATLAILLFSYFGVWLPDVIFAQENIVASIRGRDGSQLSVIQVWERGESLFVTKIKYITPNRVLYEKTVDIEEGKWWSWDVESGADNTHIYVRHGSFLLVYHYYDEQMLILRLKCNVKYNLRIEKQRLADHYLKKYYKFEYPCKISQPL
jgi:hypothetical protein